MKQAGRFRALILVILLTAITLPAIFGQPRIIDGQTGGDPWRNFIYDFQTLIAGLFAIFGAWWTVVTMRESDITAQKRHDEAMRQHRYRDELILVRARVEMEQCIEVVHNTCRRLATEGVDENGIRSPNTVITPTFYTNVIMYISGLKNCFKSESWVAAYPLRTPEIIAASEDMITVCDQFLFWGGTERSPETHRITPTEQQLNDSIWTAQVIVHCCENLTSELKTWKVN